MYRKVTSLVLAVLMVLFMAVGVMAVGLPEISTSMTPGTYSATVKGMHEGMIVEVELGETTISDITIVENHETAGVADAALAQYPGRLVQTQNLDIDTVAGATMTSNGIKTAVTDAIVQAGGNPDEFTAEVEASTVDFNDYGKVHFGPVPTQWDYTYDVVVVGGGFAGMAATHTAQELGASTVLVGTGPKCTLP